MSEFTNRTFAEIEIGTTMSFPHRLTRMDLDALALVSGEIDPFHVDVEGRPRSEIAAEAVAAEALVSAVLKRRLPGPGTTILFQQLSFSGTLGVGDDVIGTVTALDKKPEGHLVVF